MKKALAWVLVLAMTAAIAVGGTLAYLTDTDEDVNVMTMGEVKIDQLEYERVDVETKDDSATVQEFHDNKPLYPGVYEDGFDFGTGDAHVDWEQIGKDGYTSGIWDPDEINNEVDKMVFVKNKGSFDAYVRSVFAFEAGNYATLDEFRKMVHLDLNDTDWTWEWEADPVTIGESTYFVATATYNKVLEPGKLTEISLSQIVLDKTATNEDVEAFGETYQVLVKTQGIQADGFEDPTIALDEGFGAIAMNNIPWQSDSPAKGIDVRTALHYLNGDTAGTKITATVTNVVFGLDKDHPDIVDNYEGTLVDEEQDVDVYSYYVEDDGTYTVYFLASDTIYCPKNSNGLFRDMKKLVDVDMGALDVSRVETMRNMFRSCEVLPMLDTTAWDTSNVKDMAYMFQNAYKLSEIKGTENWDTSNVTTMLQTFAFCKVLKQIDCSNWDVSNVTDMKGTFGQCFALEKVDTTGWRPLSVTTTQNMFYNCYALTELVGSGDWVMPKVKALNSMFQSCSSLEHLDVSDWDLSSAEDLASMFWSSTALKEIDGSEHWNVGQVTNFKATFEHCQSLEDLDVSTWDTTSATSMHATFYNCYSLVDLDVSGWDTSNVTTMQGMFSGDGHNTGEMSFTKLAVENWDVSKVTNMNSMFYGCGQLTELDLSKWNTKNVTNFRHIFADCFKLEYIDFTGWDTSSATNFDGMFNDCLSLKELDVSDFDTQNATNFHQFFEGCQTLTTIKGLENWDTSKVTDMSEMFYHNSRDMHLEYVDLSSFDTSSLTTTYSMFNGCSRLTTVYVGNGWDMSQVTNSSSMFGGCGSLVGENGTTTAGNPADKTYACVDTEQTPGYLTYKAAEESA